MSSSIARAFADASAGGGFTSGAIALGGGFGGSGCFGFPAFGAIGAIGVLATGGTITGGGSGIAIAVVAAVTDVDGGANVAGAAPTAAALSGETPVARGVPPRRVTVAITPRSIAKPPTAAAILFGERAGASSAGAMLAASWVAGR